MYFLNLMFFLLAIFYFVYSWIYSFGWDSIGIFIVAIIYITLPYLKNKRKIKNKKVEKKIKKKRDISSDRLFIMAFLYFTVYLFLFGKVEFIPAFGVMSMSMIFSGLIVYVAMIVGYFTNYPIQRPYLYTSYISLILFILSSTFFYIYI